MRTIVVRATTNGLFSAVQIAVFHIKPSHQSVLLCTETAGINLAGSAQGLSPATAGLAASISQRLITLLHVLISGFLVWIISAVLRQFAETTASRGMAKLQDKRLAYQVGG